MQRIFIITLTLLSFFWSSAGLQAQSTDPLVYTVGNLYPADGGQKIAYLLWQPGDVATTFGKRFAIYQKAGDATSGASYKLLGITQIQTSPAAVHALLKLGNRFDFNASQVSPRINVLYAEAMNENGSEADVDPHVPGLPEAKKLSYLVNIAAKDKKVLERLFFLGRAHPGVYMALGHGFAIETASAIYTYEVRLVDALGNDLRVIGRVTLDPSKPTTLLPPSRPYPVPHQAKIKQQEVASPMDNLVTRLRWGMSPEHRRQFPNAFGYNVYRVKESVALHNGWQTTPPSASVIEDLVQTSRGNANPDAARVNTLPVMVSKIMTDAEAADLVADSETFFIHDDKDPPANPFHNGDTYYYFVAARDIAGHPGMLSPGKRIVMCDRIPPVAPVISSITNVYKTASLGDLNNQQGVQHLRLKIRQTPDHPAKNAAARYKIYRWNNPTQHIQDGEDPTTNLVATIDHVPGQTYVEWDDDGPSAPKITPGDSSQFGKTWWYTVRAEDDAACEPKNLSGHSSPAFGVLRDRKGPDRPSGTVGYCRYLPHTVAGKEYPVRKADLDLPETYAGISVKCTRDLNKISEFYIQILDLEKGEVLSQSHQFYSLSDIKKVMFPLTPEVGVRVRVRCRTVAGMMSEWEEATITPYLASDTRIKEIDFTFTAERVCRPVDDPTRAHYPHEPITPTGEIVGPTLTITIPEGAAEYRILRRVGHDGDFEMLQRGSADDLPNPLPGDITFTDPAPPTQPGVEVCYFVQVFDENGNSGARVKIGCVTIVSPQLPTPMLSGVTYLHEHNGSAQLQLNWFCDPVGVERFEIWAASSSSADPNISSSSIGPKLDDVTGSMVNEDLGDLIFSGYQTKNITSGSIGNGAEFSVVLNVPSSQTLTFTVRAVSKGPFESSDPNIPARSSGPFSNTVTAQWAPPAKEDQGVIPWPALAVPDVGQVGLDVSLYQRGEGPFFATPLPEEESHSSAILMGVFGSVEAGSPELMTKDSDPLDIFFSFRKQNTSPVPEGQFESVIPFVVYRYQLPSSVYPDAQPNLVQVSPLIDRLAYGYLGGAIKIKDPFFRLVAFNSEADPVELLSVPVEGTFHRDGSGFTVDRANKWRSVPYLNGSNSMVWWVDPMPVAKGAKYQYLIVHFTKRGEISRVIPTNQVQH